ncbi:MAG TPA: DUF4342 domain-containing protein [Fastidiosipila sp.]|jgi:hypothetical protein|nr:DUF4342 domain-containing protein [Fastidiosipila sp.]
MITVEQVDEFITKTGATYEAAKRYLEQNDGDVEAAVEEYREQHKDKEPFSADDFIGAIKQLIARGNATSLKIINNEGKTFLNLSLTISTLGVVLIPYLSLIGLGALALSDYTFLIEKSDGTVLNVNEWLARKKSNQDFDDETEPQEPQARDGHQDYY